YAHDLQDADKSLLAPSTEHWMGTDLLGRDLFSRLIYGTRISMAVSLLTGFSALILGTCYGAISGYVGGRLDNLMMRGVDVLYAIPDLLLIILITVVIGRGITGVFLALSLVGWITVARLIRGEVLRLKENAYVEAARAFGVKDMGILIKHILPNTLGVLIVTLTFRIPSAILAESTLSFIGLGLTPPAASWGSLANEGWKALKFYPHLIVFPSLAIFITMLAFNFLGDGLRDALDPKEQERL
ncbi:MAG: ABC transporter permease, partial [Nitrospirota bacterium]|nr:ABC transporter permease [Nitrospirota bacterium]